MQNCRFATVGQLDRRSQSTLSTPRNVKEINEVIEPYPNGYSAKFNAIGSVLYCAPAWAIIIDRYRLPMTLVLAAQ